METQIKCYVLCESKMKYSAYNHLMKSRIDRDIDLFYSNCKFGIVYFGTENFLYSIFFI